MCQPISIIVADDHQLIQEGFKYVFDNQKYIELIGFANNGEEAISLAERFNPDIIILDINMPGKDGIEVCKFIVENCKKTEVIVFSMCEEDRMIIRMREAGAKGYILKGCKAEELYNAVIAVKQGGEYYCKEITQRVTNLFKSGYPGLPLKRTIEYVDMELKIINLICHELTSKEIASVLKLSKRTVEHYKERIQQKMGTRSSVGIVVFALNNHLLSEEKTFVKKSIS